VFNDAGANVDFRVEGDTDANLLFVDASADAVGIGTSSPVRKFHVNSGTANAVSVFESTDATAYIQFLDPAGSGAIGTTAAGDGLRFYLGDGATEAMRIDSAGNVGIGRTTTIGTNCRLNVQLSGTSASGITAATNAGIALDCGTGTNGVINLVGGGDLGVFRSNNSNAFDVGISFGSDADRILRFTTANSERMRIDSSGNLLVGQTSNNAGVVGHGLQAGGFAFHTRAGGTPLAVNRLTNDGDLVHFSQASTLEGAISVSGNTITYGAFCGGHWTQLKEGRGYNPDIPRGTVMSSIGDMAVWKSVEWTETVEHPAIEAVEAVEAVLDEDGNVIEPAVEAVEGKDAWTETFNKRESYLGNLNIGETFEEDGFTKTVVDDGNERLPKVKISDVVGDKAVYGVFQTWDEVEDMLISSLGAFVVRVASGVTVEVGDLLESNGDGCAKVQDDDIIRSKTIGKVTSTVATATYDDGSYTVPCVIYCG
jgi:hypothetical protein